MHYVYVLKRGEKDNFYIGYTNNLERRTGEHQAKLSCKMIYYESYLTEDLARERERKLKQYGSAWRALKKRITA